MPEIRSKYSACERVKLAFLAPSLAMQQFANEADINKLMARYQKTGQFYNPLQQMQGQPRMYLFEDVSALPDMEGVHDLTLEVQDMFMRLPSVVREQFGHSPAAFVEWARKPEAIPALVRFGIIEAPKGAEQPAPAVEAHERSEPSKTAEQGTEGPAV